MADHFVGFSRGVEGFKASDFTTGTSSTGGLSMELRITDGAVRKVDAVKFLKAAERFIENRQQTVAAGFIFIDG
jgi:hypothetical protein